MKDEIARELIEEFEEQQAAADEADEGTPSFATDDAAPGEAMTGEVADEDDSTKTPR